MSQATVEQRLLLPILPLPLPSPPSSSSSPSSSSTSHSLLLMNPDPDPDAIVPVPRELVSSRRVVALPPLLLPPRPVNTHVEQTSSGIERPLPGIPPRTVRPPPQPPLPPIHHRFSLTTVLVTPSDPWTVILVYNFAKPLTVFLNLVLLVLFATYSTLLVRKSSCHPAFHFFIVVLSLASIVQVALLVTSLIVLAIVEVPLGDLLDDLRVLYVVHSSASATTNNNDNNNNNNGNELSETTRSLFQKWALGVTIVIVLLNMISAAFNLGWFIWQLVLFGQGVCVWPHEAFFLIFMTPFWVFYFLLIALAWQPKVRVTRLART